MTTQSAKYHMMDWQETTLAEHTNESKLTRVDAVFRYEGVLEGVTKTHFLMAYDTAVTGVYEGFESFTGSHDGQESSVWLRHRGTFNEQAVTSRVESLRGSGTGGLDGVGLAFDVVFEGEGPYPLTIEFARANGSD